MNLKDKLTAMAREAGFPLVAFARPDPVEQQGPLHPQAAALESDPARCMEDARSVMLMAMPYRPFRESGRDAQIDAYYLTSNAAHAACISLAERIQRELQIRALASPPVFIKPLAARSGLGEFGRNGLISAAPYGTRISVQAILLSAEIEESANFTRRLSPSCEGCGACMRACPTHALDGTGRVDVSRCLRALPESEAVPEGMRPLLGASILGCDICQRVCPRNAGISEAETPADLREALRLDKLLCGEYKLLIPFLGKNNARRQRLTARALIAAANLGRSDLLPLIRPLTQYAESDMVRQHAEWAKNILNEETPDD